MLSHVFPPGDTLKHLPCLSSSFNTSHPSLGSVPFHSLDSLGCSCLSSWLVLPSLDLLSDYRDSARHESLGFPGQTLLYAHQSPNESKTVQKTAFTYVILSSQTCFLYLDNHMHYTWSPMILPQTQGERGNAEHVKSKTAPIGRQKASQGSRCKS